jgi:2-isopropylmalate synthase
MAFDHRKYRPCQPVHKPDRRWPGLIIERAPQWCAVDLRDGNQALVKPMDVAQKQRLFDLLVKLGYKQIEVGFPAASQPDFDFCRKLIEEDRIPEGVHIQVLTQARDDQIERTFEALAGAPRAIVHVYNSTSRVHREKVFGLDRPGVREIAENGARRVQQLAAAHPETDWTFQYSPESFSATELDYALEVVDAVTAIWRPDQGQKVIINLPQTVEMGPPNLFADEIEWMNDNLARREHFSISVHTHNDRACAVAAAELACMAGADRVEGTLLGNGERTGNMDLVTMGMNLYSQGVDPEIEFAGMAEIVDVVESCTEIETHPRHPYAGELVFTAFSGSHQDAIRKTLNQQRDDEYWDVAYLPIDPRDLNRRYEEVVRINSQSGKGGVTHILERDYGVSLPRWLQIEFAKVVQNEAEVTGSEVDSPSVHALFERDYLQIPPGWQLHTYDLHRSDEGVRAQVQVGDGVTLEGRGHGAVEALVSSLQQRHGIAMAVEAYEEFALGEGTNANAMACIRVQIDGEPYSAAALAEDTTSATLQALLSAVARRVVSSQVDTALVM